MPLKLPRFLREVPLIEDGKATFIFHQWWQRIADNLETAFNSLEDAIEAVAAAQAAADAANAAAAAAQTAADDLESATTLQGSYMTGATISASDTGTDVTITVSAHTRHYTDGTTVSVDGGSVTGLAYSTTYYIYYDDAARAGGAVSYQATTTEGTSAQVGDRHSVGTITTPAAAAGPTTGNFTKWPGYEDPV